MKKSTRSYIYDVGHLRDACHTSYDGKSAEQRQKKEVMDVMNHIDDFARDTLLAIKQGTYRVGQYRHFRLRDKKKEREISVRPYPDRCVQNLYKGAIEPLIINQATDDMCAGLPGRGVTASDPRWCVVRKIQRIMRSSRAVYMWQGDIAKFYDNIRNVLVMRELERIISDKVVLALLRDHLMQQRKLAIGDPISPHRIADDGSAGPTSKVARCYPRQLRRRLLGGGRDRGADVLLPKRGGTIFCHTTTASFQTLTDTAHQQGPIPLLRLRLSSQRKGVPCKRYEEEIHPHTTQQAITSQLQRDAARLQLPTPTKESRTSR